MSCKTLREEKRLAKSVMFSQRCLGIVLKRMTDRGPFGELSNGGGESMSSTTSASTCSAGHANADPNAEDWMFESGYLIFQDFQEENRHCFWNQTLVDALNNVEFMGFVAPGTLLIGGNEYYLEGIRSAWARRVLKPPANYTITRLGDVTGFDIQVIPQIQFTPLPEALCLVISDLNQQGETASLHVICDQLRERFADMIVPNEDIIYTSLGKLIKDRKIYHTGDGYFIVTPETYRLTTMSPLPERPILMTNEEALHKLHGGELKTPSHKNPNTHRSRSIQANMDEMAKGSKSPEKVCDRSTTPSRLERFGSMRLSRKEKNHAEEDGGEALVRRRDSLHLSPERSKSLVKDINLKTSPAHQDIDKGEKISVFHKLFRRSSSKRRKGSKSPTKYATFSAQFPPLEWGDPNYIHFQSRATQTLDHRTPKDKVSSTHSLRSKTDSLTRLRDQEKRHYKSHTSDLEFSHTERQSRLDNAMTLPSRSVQKSSSVPRRSFPSSTPDTPTSPKKTAGNTSSLSRTDKRHRRAESCILVSSVKERNKKSQNSSPEKQSTHSKEKPAEEMRLNNAELKLDEDRSLSESLGSTFPHSSTLPKTKVAPYRIVPSNVTSPPSALSVMNNSPEKTLSNASTAKRDPSTPIKCINQFISSEDKSEKNLISETESTGNSKSLHRLSTSSSIGYDFDVTFTSLAAQKILKGASINSIDTLLEVNMAAEKVNSPATDSNRGTGNKDSNLSNETSSSQILNNSPSVASYKGMNLFSNKIRNQTNGTSGSSNELKLVNSNVVESKKNKAEQSSSETKVLGVI